MLSFLKRLFSSNAEDELTQPQYYFPYFFDQKEFARKCKVYGYNVEIKVDAKSNVPNDLILYSGEIGVFQFKIWTQLMFDGDKLITWQCEEDKVSVSVHNLINRGIEIYDIDISTLEIGSNTSVIEYPFINFVTYVRKSSLKYKREYFEKFVIVIVRGRSIELIPFEWFNLSKGDYGYVWPATARINLGSNYLIGEGMRMSPFVVNLKTGELLNS